MLVRLFPYNPRLGHVLRRFTLAAQGLRFSDDRGWYEVSPEIAALLRDVPQEERFPQRKAFQIAEDAEEAKQLEEELIGMMRTEERATVVGTASAPLAAIPDRPGARSNDDRQARGAAKPGGPRTRGRSTTVADE